MQYHVYFIKSSEDYYIRDSGVVGNARPCQGRDRGFEPRLSLFKIRAVNPRFYNEIEGVRLFCISFCFIVECWHTDFIIFWFI